MTNASSDAISQRINNLKTTINDNNVTLIAVSKTQPIEKIKQAYDCGLRNFGENYVQEALPKVQTLPSDITWHFIGHLQTNKVNKIVPYFHIIHTVDSLHLAEEINKQAARFHVKPTILLQVNISGETTKNGINPQEVVALAQKIVQLPHVVLNGLMTIAPEVADPEEIRLVFRNLRLLQDKLRQEVPQSHWQHLSMGMTNDYKIALEEGATMIRLGRAIFGERILIK